MDKFTRLGSDGSADLDLSAAAYRAALADWKVENETPVETIETAVEAVFDQFPSDRLPMPALVSAAVSSLGVAPAQHGALTKRIHAYIVGQADRDPETKACRGRLDIGKGKGGGVLRLATPGQSIPARPSKTA